MVPVESPAAVLAKAALWKSSESFGHSWRPTSKKDAAANCKDHLQQVKYKGNFQLETEIFGRRNRSWRTAWNAFKGLHESGNEKMLACTE